MHYDEFSFSDITEMKELIEELECAIELEGHADFPLIESVRAEGDLQVGKLKEYDMAVEEPDGNDLVVDKPEGSDYAVDKPKEDDLADDKPTGYKYACLQGLINHIFMVARICREEIEGLSEQDQQRWGFDMADQYFQHWIMPEEIQLDKTIRDSRVATGLLLLMAYRARYYLLEGPALKNAMMMNPPTERALRLPRPLRQKR